MRVSFLGPAGSFSEQAALMLCPDAEHIPCPNFQDAVKKLTDGEADRAVLPIENALNGGVLEVLDLMEREDIFEIAERVLPIDHRLAMLEGVSYADIDTVYSHQQAIGQCTRFLRTVFPTAQLVFTPSTVQSLERLDGHSAGIVGAHVKREGVVLSAENIADNKQNYTRFILAERRGELPAEGAMVFCSAVCLHRPGSLLGLLKIFQRYSLNLTRIESRPVKEEFGEYRFFIEFAGNIASDRVRTALKEAEAYCSQFKLLGVYR